MTLEEAIKHCYDVYNRLKAQDNEDCECAEEHKQLAEWLSELKSRRENERPKGEWIDYNPDLWQCSCCSSYATRLYDYCPDCGADMREES